MEAGGRIGFRRELRRICYGVIHVQLVMRLKEVSYLNVDIMAVGVEQGKLSGIRDRT